MNLSLLSLRALLCGAFLVLLTPDYAFGQDEPVPDTLDWRRYFPLEIGNQWQYRTDDYGEISYFRWRVVGDTLLDGKHYYALEMSGYDADRQLQGTNTWHIRYDTTHANVLIRSYYPDGTPIDGWMQEIPCGLDAPFNARHECTGTSTGMEYWVYGTYNTQYQIGSDTVQVTADKYFSSLGGDMILLSDVGLVWRVVEGGNPVTEVIYVKVADKEYGIAVLPTPVEESPSLPGDFKITAAYPNPFTTTATIAYRLASSSFITLEVYDLLGRRVLLVDEGHQAAGEHRYTLHGMGLQAGTYFVRLAAASGQQNTHTVTRIN